jgi:DNA polymerase I
VENTLNQDPGTPVTSSRPLVIVDGLNLFTRHFSVNQTTNCRSEPVGGILGFLRLISWLSFKFSPEQIYVVWETGGGCPRRRRLYPEYKQGRGKAFTALHKVSTGTETSPRASSVVVDPDNKVFQLTTLYKILQKTPICQLYVKDTECDDVIGYLVTQKFRSHPFLVVVSNDHDFWQLLEYPNTRIYDPSTKNLVGPDDVLARTGIAPRHWCLARTLSGDTSDNITGIPGVGLRSLQKRFQAFSDPSRDLTIENLITEATREVRKTKKPLKIYTGIVSGEDVIRRNWKLMYLGFGTMAPKVLAKIDYQLENFSPTLSPLQITKALLTAGIPLTDDYEKLVRELSINLASSFHPTNKNR